MSKLPFIPTRDMVIFPGVITPLYVGRTISIATLEKAMEKKSKIVLGMQKNPFEEAPNLKTGIHQIGVIANILQVVKMSNNTIKVLIEAEKKVEIVQVEKTKDEFVATYKTIKSPKITELKFDALSRKIIKLFEKFVNINGKIPAEILITLKSIKDLETKLNIVSSHLMVTSEDKQEILSELDFEKKGFLIVDALTKEIEISNLEKKIDDKVKDKINTSQKTYFLKEKIFYVACVK